MDAGALPACLFPCHGLWRAGFWEAYCLQVPEMSCGKGDLLPASLEDFETLSALYQPPLCTPPCPGSSLQVFRKPVGV